MVHQQRVRSGWAVRLNWNQYSEGDNYFKCVLVDRNHFKDIVIGQVTKEMAGFNTFGVWDVCPADWRLYSNRTAISSPTRDIQPDIFYIQSCKVLAADNVCLGLSKGKSAEHLRY